MFSCEYLLALQQCLQTGMNSRVAGNVWARLHCLAGGTHKWLKREQLLKLLKSRTRQSSCRGGDCVERYERLGV